MALAPSSKAGRGRPTSGRKMAFHVPLPASKSAALKSIDATDKIFCRAYMKDAVGYFLGLPLANIRLIEATVTAQSVPLLGSVQEKQVRAVPDRVSARPFTLVLEPGTTVKAGEYRWYTGGGDSIVNEEFEVKTLQIFLPNYIQVWRVLDWIAGARNTYRTGQGQSVVLPEMTVKNYNKIIAVTTPAQRTYALESILYDTRVPLPNATSLIDDLRSADGEP